MFQFSKGMVARVNDKSNTQTDLLFDEITKPRFDIDAFHEDKDLYYAFISILGRYVIKDSTYRANHPSASAEIENWFNAKDEAIAMVLFENGVERWNAEIRKKMETNKNSFWLVELNKADEKNLPPYKYTQRNKTIGSVMNDGWGYDGISRYITILQKCESFRKTPEFVEFSDNIVNSVRTSTQKRSNEKRKRYSHAEKELENSKKLADLFKSHQMNSRFDHATLGTALPFLQDCTFNQPSNMASQDNYSIQQSDESSSVARV